MPRPAVRYRRSPHLVCHWAGARFIVHNFATGRRVEAGPIVAEILHVFDDWRQADVLAGLTGRYSPASVRRALAALTRASLLERSDRPPDRRVRAMEAWRSWNPAAGFLHFSTKDLDFARGETRVDRFLRRRLRERRPPPPLKPFDRRGAVALPPARVDGSLAAALAERRTWRRFSRRPVALQDLAAALGLTFGVQRWLDLGALGRAPLKTSPSGGARHPIEAYVVARKVAGLRSGLYYYAPGAHCLAPLPRRAPAAALARYLPGQWWYRDAAVLIVMTAVFARTEWQYPYARSYRAVMLEAGHLCQTFCLVATALGLAPFCTDALADSILERDLGIDGVAESVVYAAGIGTRPSGRWTAWPDMKRRPAKPTR